MFDWNKFYEDDRINFQEFMNQIKTLDPADEQKIGTLTSGEDYYKSIIQKMLNLSHGSKYLSPHYMQMLINKAPEVGAIQRLMAVGQENMAPGNDFSTFFRNFIAPIKHNNRAMMAVDEAGGKPYTGSMDPTYTYGWGGGLDGKRMRELFTGFANRYKQSKDSPLGATNAQEGDTNLFLGGLKDSDLFNIHKTLLPFLYDRETANTMMQDLAGKYDVWRTSTTAKPWIKFLEDLGYYG